VPVAIHMGTAARDGLILEPKPWAMGNPLRWKNCGTDPKLRVQVMMLGIHDHICSTAAQRTRTLLNVAGLSGAIRSKK